MLLCNTTLLGVEGFKSICPSPDVSHTSSLAQESHQAKPFHFPIDAIPFAEKKNPQSFAS